MRRLVLVALTALVAVACASGPSKPGPNDGASLDFNAKATITIDDGGIRPEVTQAHEGDAVTVTNRGTKDHGLTSDTIDTGTLHPGESTTVFLTATGTVDLHDRADSSHTARIEVSAAANS
jgi:plastocyanin